MSTGMAAIAGAVCSLAVCAQPSAVADVVPQNHPLRRKPTVMSVSEDELPEATLLGTPRTRTLLGYMRRPLHLPDGNTMALFSFSGSGTANWLFLIDVRRLSSQRYDIPNHDVGSHGAALGADGNIYISVYDPEQPFAWERNPRELIALGQRFRQTRPRAAVTDGQLVYVSSDSAYNHLGGALAVIDPPTEQIDVYHHLIRDQNLPTLAYDPTTKLIWGGTDRWGQMRSHPPSQESSLVYAFDPKSRQVVARLVPWPKSDETKVHGVSASGILVASSGDEIALVHTETREILYQGASPVGIPGRLRLGTDGLCYCLAAGRLYRWNVAENQLVPVARPGSCRFVTESSPGLWLMADSQSIYRVRHSPTTLQRGREVRGFHGH